MKKAKIFLAHSIRNKLESQVVIPLIIQTLENTGYTVFSDHVTKMNQVQLDSFSSQENMSYHRKFSKIFAKQIWSFLNVPKKV